MGASLSLRTPLAAKVRVPRRIPRPKTIVHRTLVGSLLLWIVFSVAAPASAQRILTKDPEYKKLLTPPSDDDFLQAYSAGYRAKAAEIEARLADISDKKLRAQTRSDEWDSVPKKEKNKFKYEADVAFNQARISLSRKHPDGWFEVGRGTYGDNSNSLVVRATPMAPVEMSFLVPMTRATLNQIYDKFRQIAAPEIDRKAREFVSKSGANSNCSRNPDWCSQIKADEIEQNLRAARIMVVAQGDLEQRKIDRLMVVDYDTETILLELDPHVSAFNGIAWRFSMGLVLPPPVEPEPVAAPVQPAAAAPAGPETSVKQPAGEAEKGSAGEAIASVPSSSNAPNVASAPRARVTVPANVEAASIVTQTKPKYPAEARAAQIHGDVVLHAIIDKEGKISEVHVLSGDDRLAQPALDAVRQWRYKPMLSDGEPTEVETTITVSFSLVE